MLSRQLPEQLLGLTSDPLTEKEAALLTRTNTKIRRSVIEWWKFKYKKHFLLGLLKFDLSVSVFKAYSQSFNGTSYHSDWSGEQKWLFTIIKDNNIKALKERKLDRQDFELKGKDGNSLHDWAVIRGSYELVTYWINSAAIQFMNETILCRMINLAATYDRPEILPALLSSEVKISDTNLFNCIDVAIEYKKSSLSLLKEVNNYNSALIIKNYYKFFLRAINADKLEIVEYLLLIKPDKISLNASLLSQALSSRKPKHSEIVILLLKNNVKIKINNLEGAALEKLFTIMIERGGLILIDQLLDRYPDLIEKPYTPKGARLLNLAITNNCIPLLDSLIKRGASLNYQIERIIESKFFPSRSIQERPLDSAMSSHNFAIAERLIKAGVEGSSVLHLAIENQQLELVKEICKQDPRLKDGALSTASELGFEEIVCYLIENGANLKYQHKNTVTPLELAVERKHTGVVRRLLDAKADSTQAIHIATVYKNLEVIEDALIRDPNSINSIYDGNYNLTKYFHILSRPEANSLTPLHLAAYNGDLSLVNFFLGKGADRYAFDINGQTPLHYAMKAGCADVVQTLLENKQPQVKFEKAHEQKITHEIAEVVIWAAGEGHIQIVKMVIDRVPAYKESSTINQWTSLMAAASRDRVLVVEYLLSQNVKLDKLCDTSEFKWQPSFYFQKTALDLAFEKRHKKIVALLLKKAGLDAIKALNEYSIHINIAKAVVILTMHGWLSDEIINALSQCNDMADLLGGIIFNKKDHLNENFLNILLTLNQENLEKLSKSKSLLHWAISYFNDSQSVEHFVKPSLLEAIDAKGYTPLVSAAKSKKWKIVEVLFINGASFVPLVDYAIRTGDLNLIKFVNSKYPQYLSASGFDIKKTPIGRAITYGHQEIVKYLLGHHDDQPKIIDLLELASQDKMHLFPWLFEKSGFSFDYAEKLGLLHSTQLKAIALMSTGILSQKNRVINVLVENDYRSECLCVIITTFKAQLTNPMLKDLLDLNNEALHAISVHPLYWAAARGHETFVDGFIDDEKPDALIKKIVVSNQSALEAAAENKCHRIVANLLKATKVRAVEALTSAPKNSIVCSVAKMVAFLAKRRLTNIDYAIDQLAKCDDRATEIIRLIKLLNNYQVFNQGTFDKILTLETQKLADARQYFSAHEKCLSFYSLESPEAKVVKFKRQTSALRLLSTNCREQLKRFVNNPYSIDILGEANNNLKYAVDIVQEEESSNAFKSVYKSRCKFSFLGNVMRSEMGEKVFSDQIISQSYIDNYYNKKDKSVSEDHEVIVADHLNNWKP